MLMTGGRGWGPTEVHILYSTTKFVCPNFFFFGIGQTNLIFRSTDPTDPI